MLEQNGPLSNKFLFRKTYREFYFHFDINSHLDVPILTALTWEWENIKI